MGNTAPRLGLVQDDCYDSEVVEGGSHYHDGGNGGGVRVIMTQTLRKLMLERGRQYTIIMMGDVIELLNHRLARRRMLP